MKKTITLPFLAMCALIALAGCSYFDQGRETVAVQDFPPPESIDLTHKDSAALSAELEPSRLDVTSVDQGDLSRQMTAGRVELFDTELRVGAETPPALRPVLTQEAEAPVSLLPAMDAQGGSEPAPAENAFSASPAPYNFDSSVEVFPLDEALPASLKFRGKPPFLRPPSEGSVAIEPVSGEAPEQPQSAEPLSFKMPVQKEKEEAPVSLARSADDFIKIFFAHDSVDMKEEEKETVSQLIKNYAYYADSIFSIEGHASQKSSIVDPVQRKLVNLKISMERAFSVSRALIATGIPAEKIKVVAWGESKPSAAMENKDSESASRRVEIRPLSGQ